jgi:hypothetical protein
VALDLGCAVGYYASARSELGSADDAKAMLVKVNAAVKADRDIALAQFNKGEVGFRNGDLYPFCTRISDAKGVAGSVYTPAGVDVTKLIDAKGHAYGAEMLISMTRARIRC